MRLGILGGSFDPIHYGHLVAAEETRAALKLDRVLFVPTAASPFKMGRVRSPPEDRFRMAEMAVASNPRFAVSRIEIDRPPPSYTVETLRLLSASCEADLYFIVGEDAARDIALWKEPQEIVRLARLAVVTRPGLEINIEEIAPWLPLERVHSVHIPQLEISSTDLRLRIATGRSIKYQLPECVEAYIAERGLYR
ncbi:MAG: nicotinate-nucleotide adenylyltransferase [Armatimonadetes bacterium]|nr:nicotinate-nucleotide adenylyltransferase [Armatimonadota bacterium]